MLRTEVEQRTNKFFSEKKWLKNNIEFFTNHTFFTNYARENFDEQKNLHLTKLQKRYRKVAEKKEKNKLKKEKIEIDKAILTAVFFFSSKTILNLTCF